MIGGTPPPLQPGFEQESAAHNLALFLPGIYLTGAASECAAKPRLHRLEMRWKQELRYNESNDPSIGEEGG
jgi:hypothetical protein